MSEPPSSRRIQFTLRELLVTTLVVAAFFAGQATTRQVAEQAEEARRQIAAARVEAELSQLENDLKVPSEALYCDDTALWEIGRLRSASAARNGVSHCLGYRALRESFGPPHDGIREVETDNLSQVVCGSFEIQSRDVASERCNRLAHDWLHNQNIAEHLRENPDVFQQRIRPLLLRLMSVEPRLLHSLPVDACHALLASGDRSFEVRLAMKRMLDDPIHFNHAAAVQLNEEYQLEPRLQQSTPGNK